jgi:hypothetical protein
MIANSGGKNILGEARAADHEGAQGSGERLARGRGCALEFETGVGRQDGNGVGVFEDERPRVMQLVRGTAHGDTESGA